MTTETRQDARRTGVSTLVRASAAAAVIGLAIALVALVVAGGAGFLAAMIGAVVVVAVLFSGALVVTVVADLMPAASLLVALMTYTLQMALLALVLIPLSRTEWSSRELDAAIKDVVDEDQVYRIDHFLGKEAVQNILALRFANGLFEPAWNATSI